MNKYRNKIKVCIILFFKEKFNCGARKKSLETGFEAPTVIDIQVAYSTQPQKYSFISKVVYWTHLHKFLKITSLRKHKEICNGRFPQFCVCPCCSCSWRSHLRGRVPFPLSTSITHFLMIFRRCITGFILAVFSLLVG